MGNASFAKEKQDYELFRIKDVDTKRIQKVKAARSAKVKANRALARAINEVGRKTKQNYRGAWTLMKRRPTRFWMVLNNLSDGKRNTIYRVLSQKTGYTIGTLRGIKQRNPDKFFPRFQSYLKGSEFDPEVALLAKSYFEGIERDKKAAEMRLEMELEKDPKKRRLLSSRLYSIKNPEKRALSQKAFQGKTANKIIHNLRCRVRGLVTKVGFSQKLNQGSCESVVGCKPKPFFMFEDGMEWTNYGDGSDKWSIDHIICLTYFNKVWESGDKEKIRAAAKLVNHFTNLVPMWDSQNKKKKNRMPLRVYNRGVFLWSDLHEEIYTQRKIGFLDDQQWEEECFNQEQEAALIEKHEAQKQIKAKGG